MGKSFFSHVGSCVNRANDLSKSATRGVCMSVKARKRKKTFSSTIAAVSIVGQAHVLYDDDAPKKTFVPGCYI